MSRVSLRSPHTAGLLALAVACGTLVAVGASAHADSTSASSQVTITKTVTRSNLVAGVQQDLQSNTVSLTVSQTSDLRSQRVAVTWSGAHPTGGITNTGAFSDNAKQEYPMVLLECRGTDDSASTPVVDRLSPQTCWTQTPTERFQSTFSETFPPYRLDEYATLSDRDAVVNSPPSCDFAGGPDSAPVQHYVPFIAADGTTYPGDPSGVVRCNEAPPEVTGSTTADHPSNTVYGVTDTSGNGSALFNIWTEQDNASLGCSDTVPCSLVAVPIMGISCDTTGSEAGLSAADIPPASAAAECEAAGHYAPGSVASANLQGQELSVTGSLWWSASNWKNRMVVPLSFAASSDVCSQQATQPLAVYGSELMIQATDQWAPSFCTGNSSFTINHVQTEEPQARNLVNEGAIEAAFTSNAPDGGYTNPTVSAPTAVTGFAVSYVVDSWDGDPGQPGTPYHSLRLDARLLAKLITESYLPNADVAGHPGLTGNPRAITQDPEFIALNPGVGQSTSISTSSMTILSSDSDIIWALTSYIYADPEARAWLEGTPDPWGMKVNPSYRINDAANDDPDAQLSLPTVTWPLLDQYMPVDDAGVPYGNSNNDCLKQTPTPELPLFAGPVSRITTIADSIEQGEPTSQVICAENDADASQDKLTTGNPEQPGERFILGITSLGDADRDLLDTAQLETQSSASSTAKITDATGRTFVGPSDSSLLAAADTLTPDQTDGTWTLPYSQLRSDAADAQAYPGTMLISTAVPTSGLPAADAGKLADFLKFVATTGQTPGLANGQLPPGYLPITSAHGLEALVSYTTAAAADVAAQQCAVPSLDGSVTATSTGGCAGVGTGGDGSGSGDSATAPSAGTASSTKPAASPSASSAAGSATVGTTSAATGSTAASAPLPDLTPSAGVSSRVPVVAPAAIEPASSGLAEVAKTGDAGAGFLGSLVPMLLLVAVACGGLTALIYRFASHPAPPGPDSGNDGGAAG